MVKYAFFDGTQGTIVVSGYSGIIGDNQRSISFWIRTEQESLATICYWGDDLSVGRIPDGSENRVRLIDGFIELFGKGSGRKSASRVNDGNFHYIVCTWSKEDGPPGHDDFQQANIIVDAAIDNGDSFGQSRRFLLPDGTEVSNTAINTPSETEVVLGARPSGSGGGFTEFYSGDMDEFAVYNDVMSSGTISGAYNEGVRGADLLSLEQAAALQFWYRMGDDPQDTAPSGGLPPGVFVDQNTFTGRNAVVTSGVTISG